MVQMMETYRDAGFNGPFMLDHTPEFPNGQSFWAGHAYAVGYMRALIQVFAYSEAEAGSSRNGSSHSQPPLHSSTI